MLALGVAAAERDQAPALVTEFGATIDPAVLNRLTAQMERALLPWLDWAYNESVIADPSRPAGDDNLRSVAAFAALVRPHPVALSGTPTRIAFDPARKRFELDYDPLAPDGRSYPRHLLSAVAVPPRQYPDGYTVTIEGATVTCNPCAALLTLRNDPEAAAVSLVITPPGGG